MFKLAFTATFVALLLPVQAGAQVMPAPTTQTVTPPSTSAPLPPEGVVRGHVTDVLIKTQSQIGPYTAFLLAPSNDLQNKEWFYIRNTEVAKALERGAMVGLLMGAAQTNRWIEDGPRRFVTVQYNTVDGHKEVVAVTLGGSLR